MTVYNPENSLTHEGQLKEAREKGCVVVYPGPNDLFVDIDSEDDLDFFHEAIVRLRRYFPGGDILVNVTPSKSPGRYHATVTIPRPVKDAAERILLQAVLGSDRVRELLSWARLETGATPHPTVFFEKP
jgi:hypothetical protein